MTPEKQRIAIAEACGWTWKARVYQPRAKWLFPPNVMPRFDGSTHWLGNIVGEFEPCDPPETITFNPFGSDCPDYLNDLNAMMEAFKHLGRHWQIAQVEDGFVCTIQFGPRNKDVVVGGLELCPVMAEAFLRTLNLWED